MCTGPCEAGVAIPYKDCLKPCDGIYVDVKKYPVEIVQLPEYQILIEHYSNYTWMHNMKYRESRFEENQHKKTLKFVRIFIDTTRFNKITKDRAAKFVDMLSAIGGTMGLLTGFSIISAVEIFYYANKLIMSCLMKKKKH